MVHDKSKVFVWGDDWNAFKVSAVLKEAILGTAPRCEFYEIWFLAWVKVVLYTVLFDGKNEFSELEWAGAQDKDVICVSHDIINWDPDFIS